MSSVISITASGSYAGSNTVFDVIAGSVTVAGAADTVISAASGIGISLQASNSLISVTGSNNTISAGVPAYGASAYDSLFLGGNYNTVTDHGFQGGGVTIGGSHNTLTSNQKTETSNFVVNGSYNTITNLYLGGNMTINGSNESITVGAMNVVINGNNDTITTVHAKSINDAGNNNVIVNEAIPGQMIPYNLFNSTGTAGTDTTPGAAITVTGSGASITTLTNNNSVVASGGQSSIAALSYNNSISVSGAQSAVSTQSTSEKVTISGSNSTISTATAISVPSTNTAPKSTLALVGNSSVGTVYNDASSVVTVTSASFPIIINITSRNATVVASANETINDSVGGNHFSVSGASLVNISAPGDTVQVADGSVISQDSINGATINFGSNDLYYGQTNNFYSSNNVLNVSGKNNTGVLYAAAHDTLNESGSGNLFVLQTDGLAADSVGSTINVSGKNLFLALSNNNTISGANGAQLQVESNGNVITGSDVNLQVQGTGNSVNVTGSDTISDSSPYNYQAAFDPSLVAQNAFSVQSGAVSLGGLDTLLQTQGTAQINLVGGNSVTLYGSGDTVTASDQIYAGNVIVNNGFNNNIALLETNMCADTIIANSSTAVTLTDITGAHIGGNQGNAVEKLTFIGGAGTASTIMGAASNAAMTIAGGASNGNIVYGGAAGSNSLNGGIGGGDLFVAGGTNDVLIGGSAGNNTLVSATGNETFFSAAVGTDLISITGGGGNDFIQGFKGSLSLATNLSVTSETAIGGSLNVLLNDGTRLIFTGLSSVTQNGNLFTH